MIIKGFSDTKKEEFLIMGRIHVLRLGHRIDRDKRVSSHIALVCRALGVDSLIITVPDPRLQKSIDGINRNFGSQFKVEVMENWKGVIQNWDGLKVHLTMYGKNVDACIQELITPKDVLLIVGSQKVPPNIYELVDLNVAVGHQPHSEIAALAIVIDRMTLGKGIHTKFLGKMKVVPSANRKGNMTTGKRDDG